MSLLENIYLVVSIILWHDSCPSNTNINHEYCSTLEHMNVDNSNKSHFAKPHTAGNGVFCCYIPLSLLVCLCNHYPNLCRKHLAIKKALEASNRKLLESAGSKPCVMTMHIPSPIVYYTRTLCLCIVSLKRGCFLNGSQSSRSTAPAKR